MGETRAERLLRGLEGVAYWGAVAPALACLPAALGYRIACWRGDWDFRYRRGKRAAVVRNLRQLLGDDLGPDDAERLTRDWFRFASCNAIDVMRLRYRARPLRRLVEIRGREHLEAALAGGKGAIVCSAHFGSFDSAFSLLGIPGAWPVSIRCSASRKPERSRTICCVLPSSYFPKRCSRSSKTAIWRTPTNRPNAARTPLQLASFSYLSAVPS